MPRYTPVVKDYMSSTPVSVSPHESLEAARKLMREYSVRHLAVVQNGMLVGLLSERNMSRPSMVATPAWRQTVVSDAMSRELYTIPEETPLNKVARDMAERKIGSAVVMDGKKIAGIFTTIDAMHALADALEGKHAGPLTEEMGIQPHRGRTRPLSPPRARAT